MKLKNLINNLNNKYISGDTDIEIKNICIDSKAVLPGSLFICIKGEKDDGHSYYNQALQNGAAAIITQKKLPVSICQVVVGDSRAAMTEISEKFYGYPSSKLKMIGITGTNGKTTVSYMIKSILEGAGKNTAVIGTLGIFYANREIAPELTTPDPICFNKTLADMVDCGVEYVVMEVSAHALFYQKTGSTVFDVGVFTNLSQDHLDFFKTMDNYRAAKKSFFTKTKLKKAIYNFDDKTGREFSQTCDVPFLSYGIDNPSDAFAVNAEHSIGGTAFVLNLLDQIIEINLRLLGKFNISNALAAATACSELGIDMETIAKGLRDLSSVSGRLEYAGNYNGGDIFVDFAHTPEGIESLLQSLKVLKPARLICLFGCGGNRDRTKRAVMGETVGKMADFTVITSDNPRYEDPIDIISDIEQGIRNVTKKYVTIQDRKCAILYGIEHLKQGDILVIAGKGAETYQEIMGIKHLYNDNAVINQILSDLTNNV